jgi:F-type H+-transporting ATPase subunit b
MRFVAVAAVVAVLAAFSPSVASAQEAEGGIGALGFSLPGLIAQLVNFTILLIVLRLFLYKPVLRILDERRRRIQEGVEAAAAAAAAATQSESESRRALEQARAEGQEAIARAQDAAARLREELETRARAEAEQIVARAREEIALERDQAIEQLRREFGSGSAGNKSARNAGARCRRAALRACRDGHGPGRRLFRPVGRGVGWARVTHARAAVRQRATGRWHDG